MRTEFYKTNSCRTTYPERKLKKGVNYLVSIGHKIYTGSNSEAENVNTKADQNFVRSGAHTR
jgi:hypothetical protein